MAAGFGRWTVVAAVLAAGLGAPAAAQEQPLSVTYGPRAPTAEGDPDYRKIFLLSVPETLADRLYLRVFDPDTGGEHDLVYGTGFDTQTRFVLFGGEGAASAADPAGWLDPTPEQLAAGRTLAERVIGESEALDGKWSTLATFAPEDGELLDGRRHFRLVVQGVAGNDANLYSVTLSLRDLRNLEPDDLAIISYRPTLRVPTERLLTEMRFLVPPEAERLTVRNFDLADADIRLQTAFRALPLASSGQDNWAESEIELTADERGRLAAVTFQGGAEMPNDGTFEILADGVPVAIQLPARAWRPNSRPEIAADIVPLASCFAVAFDASRTTDADGDRLSFAWELGDGATATGAAIVHRYPGPGTYQATLRVTDASGQVGNGSAQSFEVFLKRPPTAVAGEARTVAPSEPVAFDGSRSRDGDRPIVRHLWDFQDGTLAEGALVEHAFARPGRYLVTLRVEDDSGPPCDFGVETKLVHVNAAPLAVAGEDRRVAVGETVRLDGGRSSDTDGAITAHQWDLGDGTRASGAVVEHAYATPGTYTVTLTVRDDANVANSSAADTLQVVVNAPPVAVAGPDRRVAIGEVITFDGSASRDPDGAIIRYGWEFGDGARGQGRIVEYAYPRPGRYRVLLTVQDDSTTSTGTAIDWLTVVVNEPPTADAGPDQIVTASEVRFDGTGSRAPGGTIASYHWDFGDGATGAGPTPTHVYGAPGSYLVRLTVTDDSGTIRNTATDTMRVVVNASPIADAGPDLVGMPGQLLTFRAGASLDPDGDVTDYLWDFTDGATATGAVVQHAFRTPGIYHVRLTVRDDTAHDAARDYDEARVFINAPPVARAGPDLLAAPGDAVRFDAANSFDPDGTIISYRWDFSDAAEPLFGSEVTRSYAAPGVYTAQLTVTDDSGAGNAVARDEVTIRINHAPVAAAGSDIVTADTTVTFDGSQSADADGDALTYRWDFGDGSPPAGGARVTHSYADGGIYPVVLTVDDGTGLRNATDTAAIIVTINRPPVAIAGVNKSACAGDVVVFDGSASFDPDGGLLRYRWDFGDGTTADIVNPTKIYRDGGLYEVSLTVEDESGFADNRHTDRIVVRIDESPIAQAGPDQLVCTGTEVHFDGSRSWDADGVVNRFLWDFGDGRIGGGERPVHVYGAAGRYRVLLTIEGDEAGQCDNTHTDELVVEVVEAPVARIAGPARVAAGTPARFDGSGSSGADRAITAWRWELGDGAVAEGQTITHTFATPGTYLVRLVIETAGSASTCAAVAAQHQVIVNAPPVAVARAPTLVGVDQLVQFDGSASSDPDGAITAHDWDFGDGTTARGIQVRHRFRTSGTYPVTLMVRDDAGLPNSATTTTIMVTVNDPPQPVIAAPAAACPGEPVTLSAAGSRKTDGAIASFAWELGDGSRADGVEVTHSYREPGRYAVALIADDGRGLNNSRSQTVQPLHINRRPFAMAGPDRLVCPGEPVRFDGAASADWDGRIIEHLWEFGDGKIDAGAAVTHVFEAPGRYEVKLAVTDDSGTSCATATDVAVVEVVAPPVAVAGGDREGFVGGAHDQLRFDASASRHPDGRPLSFVWELDGVRLAGERVLHGFAAPGDYAVRLGVSDDSGLACGQAWDEMTVTLRRRP